MPQKNSRKEYEPGGYYHVYNRGVEKRIIFCDEADYKTFLGYLKLYLTKPNLQGLALKDEDGHTISPSRVPRNFVDDLELHAYCLMPNHFHFLLRQNNEKTMAEFMHSLMMKYVMYFNKKYQRVGSLFQGRYKCVRIESEQQYTYVSKYIHRNPVDILPTGPGPEGLREYKYSSYQNYLGLFTQSWIKKDDILSYFSKTNPKLTYQNFVEESGDLAVVYKLMLDMED